MLRRYSISVLVVARNEETTIKNVLTECIKILPKLAKNYEIIINNDASTDQTTSILRFLSKKYSFIKIFHQKQSLGIAGGLEFLYKKATKNLVFTLSGDGQYTINDLPKMLEKIESGYDLVIGKRIQKQYNWSRNFISFCFNFVPRILFGVNLYDAGSIKLYKREVLQKTTPLSKSVFNEAERIIRASKLGYKVTYTPVQHLTRKKGASSIKSSIVCASLLDMFKFFLIYLMKKNYIFFLPVCIIMLSTLSTFLSWPLSHGFYPDLLITQSIFGKNIDFLPLSKFFQHYAMQFGPFGILYKIFAFNAWAYFAMSISLKILAAFFIFHFINKWSKSKFAAIVSSLFFGVNTAGIQSTIDVTLIQIYVAIILLIVFLDRWFTFHDDSNTKNLIQSAVFFGITILSYPERMVGIVFLVLAGEFYWLIDRYKNKKVVLIKIKHFLLIIAILLMLFFVTGSLKPPEEFTSKRVSTLALLLSLLTGSHVTIPGIFSFIGNLLIPGAIFNIYPTSEKIMSLLSYCIPLIGTIFLIICLIKRKFLLAFVSTIAVVFSPIIFLYQHLLIDWSKEWILLAQVGGSLFILFNLIIFFVWEKNKRIAQLGLLGSALVLSNLLLPWLITPQFLPSQSQSAFNFVHRYYTLPSVGMGILLGSVFLVSIRLIRENLQVILEKSRKFTILQLTKILVTMALIFSIFITLIFLIFIHLFAIQKYLNLEQIKLNPINANPKKIDLLWAKLSPQLSNIALNKESVIYIEQDGSLAEKYIAYDFPERLRFHLNLTSTPKLKIIFNKKQFVEYLKDNYEIVKQNSFYAFKWHNNSLIDIKKEVLKSL